jgi:L-amino acid N-acyltransferase YncA
MLREEVVSALEDEKLKAIAEKYHVPIEQVKTAMRSKTKDWEKLLAKRKTETDGGDCTNGHCQKIVSEQELPPLLAAGWTFVATLPSGKCVVNNETS